MDYVRIHLHASRLTRRAMVHSMRLFCEGGYSCSNSSKSTMQAQVSTLLYADAGALDVIHTAASGLHPAFPVGECGVCKLSVATKNDERAKLRSDSFQIMRSCAPYRVSCSLPFMAGSAICGGLCRESRETVRHVLARAYS
jgi:hypothetical protein